MSQMLTESPLDPHNAVLDQVCDAGDPWMAEVKKGQIFRILDLEGNQAVDTLFYSAADPEERYSAVDTIARQRQLYLTTGSVLYSSEGRPMLTITATILWAGPVPLRVTPCAMPWKSAPCTAAAIASCMRSTIAAVPRTGT